MSLARILVFAIALTHVVGLAELVMDDGCEETCTDDGCTDCLPGVACRCHSPSALPLASSSPSAVARVAAPRDSVPFSVEQRLHESPDPREILHVPKHAV